VCGQQRRTWEVLWTFDPQDSTVHAGDTINIETKKGLSVFDTLTIRAMALSVDATIGTHAAFKLQHNFPNPFNPSTTIRYEIGRAVRVSLVVYDILGREVRVLQDEVKPPGRYDVQFNAQNLASGVYFYRLRAGGFAETQKLCIVK
jgi:hypothetical protein